MTLSQAEFDHLIGLDKYLVDESPITLTGSWSREVLSETTKDTFLLDYRSRRIELTKFSYNHRYRKSIVLLRLCATGRHLNPDGTQLDGPHLHIYREGFDDKTAFPITELGIEDDDIERVGALDAFMDYCRIVRSPGIQTSLGGIS